MTDKLELAINRAAQAETLMRNELLQSSFKSLEADYLKAWGATEAAETTARENYWRAIQILGDVHKHLNAMITNGKLARIELNKLGGVNRAA